MDMRPHESGYVLLYDASVGQWLEFSRPAEIVSVFNAADVVPAIELIEKIVSKGYWAAGFVAYEAAPGFDDALQVHAVQHGLPLLYFGLYREPRAVMLPQAAWKGMQWQPDISETEYAAALRRIREHLQQGHTYQVNYTMRFNGLLEDDPLAVFSAVQPKAAADYGVYLDCGRHAVCSFSPELFFTLEGDLVRTRPMKGTAPRGRTKADDEAWGAWLASSEKNRAENLMIVDMLRNDLGRIALPGTVRVPRLFEVEKYPTLFQMTSTVEARTDASFSRIFEALFPCASITGAPKVSTMAIIADLEAGPRGIYTGSLGFMGPGRRAQFNVAIRTMIVDKLTRQARYGAGGGIVWDSETDNEYAECLLKTRVVACQEE